MQEAAFDSSKNELPLPRNPVILEGSDDLTDLSFLNEPEGKFLFFFSHSLPFYAEEKLCISTPKMVDREARADPQSCTAFACDS
jgi:hypothetical protein